VDVCEGGGPKKIKTENSSLAKGDQARNSPKGRGRYTIRFHERAGKE